MHRSADACRLSAADTHPNTARIRSTSMPNQPPYPPSHGSGDRNENPVADTDAKLQKERDEKIDEGEKRRKKDADRDEGHR
jgi:hypothetical protein